MIRAITMSHRRARLVAGVLCLAASATVLAPAPSQACSIFALSTDRETVYGQNLDWHDPFPGHVIVNKRGVGKTVLPWKGSWPVLADSGSVSWISRFGSVTFTCYGRDFIEGGMNQAGLMVDETNFYAVYPQDDGRPGVSCPQWMQYQLDNFATVDEVLEHLDDLRPDGEGWHYLIADASGESAVIEYAQGKAVVYSGSAVEVCALTNTDYASALGHLPLDAAFGGKIDIAAGSDAYGRFLRMAILLRDYDPRGDAPAADYAFKILGEVSCDETLRSVVYDSGRSMVLWSTPGNPPVRWLDLGALDFSPGTPTKFLDVEAGGPGDVSALLMDYTVDANRALVAGVLDSDQRSPETIRELEARGLTFDRALDLIARHPSMPGP